VQGVNDKLYSTKSLIQTNTGGIKIPTKDRDKDLPSNSLLKSSRIFAVNDREGQFHRIAEVENDNLILEETTTDVALFTGVKDFVSQIKGDVSVYSTGSYMRIDIKGELATSDKFRIEEKSLENTNDKRWCVMGYDLVSLSEGEGYSFSSWDEDNNEWLSYFYPSGRPESIAKAIAAAFASFDNLLFDVVAVGASVYFKSKFEGQASNLNTLTYDLVDTDISAFKIFDIDLINATDTVNFIGGSESHRRLIVKNSNLKELTGTEWFKTIEGYSQTMVSNILGSTISSYEYLDSPIYDHGKIIEYDKIDIQSYVAVTSGNLYTNTAMNAVAYTIYTPSLSIFSFFPVKDYDFDTLKSEYSYYPLNELNRLFVKYDHAELEGKEVTIELNKEYAIYYTGNFTVTDPDPIKSVLTTYTANGDIINQTPLANYTYFRVLDYKMEANYDTATERGANVTTTDFTFNSIKIDRATITFTQGGDHAIIVNPDSLDSEVTEFQGFSGLRDFIDLNMEREFLKLASENSPERFELVDLDSEYQYLEENYQKDLAVKSKVVPYINKWVIVDGTDARNNPYRLNNSLAFGTTNLSPDHRIRKQEPELLTHEWFHLGSVPELYDIEKFKSSRSYIIDSLNTVTANGSTWYELLKDTTNDYFTKYFTIGSPNDEYLGASVGNSKKEYYSHTSYNEASGYSEALHKGAKYRFIEMDKSGNELKHVTSVNGYKFSAVIKRNSTIGIEPVTFEFIRNDKFKTITLVISIRLDDYKFRYLDYLALYTSVSSRWGGWKVPYIDELYNEFGDTHNVTDYLLPKSVIDDFLMNFLWRSFQFPDDVSLSSNLDYLTADNQTPQLVSFKNIFIEPTVQVQPIPVLEWGVTSTDQINTLLSYSGSPEFDYEIDRVDFGKILSVFVDPFSSFYISVDGITGTTFDATSSIYDLSVNDTLIPEQSAVFNPNSGLTPITRLPGPVSFNDLQTQADVYVKGGEGINKTISELASYASFFNNLVNESNVISYTQFDTDGASITPTFKVKTIKPSEFIIENLLDIEDDNDIPAVYRTAEKIGFNVYNALGSKTLQRHPGIFEPKTRDVVKFAAREVDEMTTKYGKDFILCNTKIIDDNAIIENIYINKISDVEVMKTSKESSYEANYALVGEIPIVNKDMSIFSSPWDKGYFRKYQSSIDFTSSEKIVSPFEEKSFLGSKILSVPNILSLSEFEQLVVDRDSFLTPINISDPEISISSNTTADKEDIGLRFNIRKRALRKFITDGDQEFALIRSISLISIEEYVTFMTDYYDNNIMDLYQVKSVMIYEKPFNGTDRFKFDLTEQEIINQGYTLKDIPATKIGDLYYEANIHEEKSLKKTYAVIIELERI
jgi:hypothetical protein